MSPLVKEVLRRTGSVDDLIALIAELSGRAAADVRTELVEHLASRVAFLLLGDVLAAPNYTTIEARVAARFQSDRATVSSLASELAQTVAWVEAAGITRKTSLRDLPYPMRQRLFAEQRNRCGICGWLFSDDVPPWRAPEECTATLDHRMPYRLGGEALQNLWILCGLCNRLKESRVHVGEHGRVWINNHVYYEGLKPVAFWTLRRDRICTICGRGPDAVRMRIRRHHDAGAWVADNCRVLCAEHKEVGGALDY